MLTSVEASLDTFLSEVQQKALVTSDKIKACDKNLLKMETHCHK